jgi:hypothetical protein
MVPSPALYLRTQALFMIQPYWEEFKSQFVGTGAAGIMTFQQFNNVSLMAV